MPPENSSETVITRNTRVELMVVIALIGATTSFGFAASEFKQLRTDVNTLTNEVNDLRTGRIQINDNTREIASIQAQLSSTDQWTRNDQEKFCLQFVNENPGSKCTVD